MAARPTILFVFPTNNEYGACRAMLDLIEGLPERGFEPRVALTGPGPVEAKLDRMGIPSFPIQTRSWKGGPKPAMKLVRRRVRDLATGIRVGKIAREQGVDLVHTNTLASPVGAFIAAHAGVPHVWHLHEIADSVPGSGFRYGLDASSRLMNRLTHRAVGVSRFVVESTARYIQKDKLRLIYGGNLDLADAHRPLPARPLLSLDRPLRLLLVGKISPRKGQRDAIRALAALRRQGLEASLTLVGDGRANEVTDLRAFGAEMKVTDAIDLVGHADPKPYYATHDLSLLCGPFDPLPRVAVESQASGIPTVAIRSGGIPEIVEDGKTGWLYDPDVPGTLADAILRAVRTSPDERRAIVREGHRRAFDRFNTARYRDENVALYRELGVG